MTLIYIAAFGCLALSIPVAIWIKKHLSTSTKLIGLPVFLIIANEVKFTSQNFPDWLNIILVFIFSVVCGGVMVYIGCEVLNIWSKISPTETNALNNKNNESDYDIDFDDWRSSLKKHELEMELRKKISEMEFERAQLITTNNSLLGLNDSHLSQAELDRNRERWRYLSDKIMEFTLELQKLH